MFNDESKMNDEIIESINSSDSDLFNAQNDNLERNVEGQSKTELPPLGEQSIFDKYIDEQNKDLSNLEIEISNNQEEVSEKKKKKLDKKKIKKEKDIKFFKENIAIDDNTNKTESSLSDKQEKKIKEKNKKIDEELNVNSFNLNEQETGAFRGEYPRNGLHYVDAFDVDVDSIKPWKKTRKFHKNTELFINTKIYNRFIEYLPSDFTASQIIDLFIDLNLIHLPSDSGFKLKMFPNDVERTMRVEVYVDRFYKDGEIVEKRKVFSPFWITGFSESVLYATTYRPIEKNYRVNKMNTFAYRETTKILNKKISAKYITLSRDKFATEQDFQQAQALKNSYIKHHIDRLNAISTIEWECVPELFVDWKKKRIVIKLYLKIISTVDYSRLPHILYVDSFNVNLNELLDLRSLTATAYDENPRERKYNRKLIDINTIMYLIALNAMYKNILIFSYNTLYECYKLISYQILQRGFDLKPITTSNLSTLKIVDFSKHFVCAKKMFDDRLLHLMNLKSSNEEYYRMKYMYTVQKNPSLLYSDFIVKEFEKADISNLSLLLRNEEEIRWKKRILDLRANNSSNSNFDKDFYINNYNIFDVTDNNSSNVEEYLLNVIKEEKDEISRIAALGHEILAVDQKSIFTKKELKELQRTSRKLNRLPLEGNK